MTPTLIIPGAQKSGTTTLFRLLAGHPRISPSEPKETHFFSSPLDRQWAAAYADHFPATTVAGDAWRLEASTSYLFLQDVPGRIADRLGDAARYVVVLREPIERSLSAHWHMVRNGTEHRPLDTVLDALPDRAEDLKQIEDERIAAAVRARTVEWARYAARFDDPAWPFRYLSNSLYGTHLDRLISACSPKHVLVIFTSELRDDPAGCVARVLEFVGLEDPYDPDDLDQVDNRSSSSTLVARRGRLPGIARSMQRFVPPSVRRALRNATGGLWPTLMTDTAVQPRPSADSLTELRSLFAPDLKRLEEIAGISAPSEWSAPSGESDSRG